MKSLVLALQFLTIIPVRTNMAVTEKDIPRSASAFVIVGIIQGILLIIADYIGVMLFQHDLVIGLMLLALVLSNGGFHLDGLADTFDALAIKSSGNPGIDREKRFSVMKDAAAGPIGVIAIIFALAIKYLSLKNISHLPYFTYYSSLMLMPVLSKWTMVVSMFHGRPARKDGLGRIFIDGVGFKEVAVSTLMLLILLASVQLLFIRQAPNNLYIFYSGVVAAMYILSRVCIKFFDNKFGGLNGDMLGAISEITEAIFLLTVIVWSRLSI